MGRQTPDLTGQRFERLVALRRAPRIPGGTTHAMWQCLCDCGTEVSVTSSALRSGSTRSCGCLRRESTRARNTKHGGKPVSGATPTYNSWMNMLRRCRPEHPRYKDWGGRGIVVCDRWKESYSAFLADMGEKPPGLTLGRKDNDGPYSPENCEWETPAQQSINRRGFKLTPETVRKIQDLADTGLTMTAIGKQLGMGRHTVAKALWTG